MTTTDLLKILSGNEYGAISHKPRNISLTINGKYMPDPQITLSSTGDGIVGPEIDLDIDGEFFEEQRPCEDKIIEWKKDFKEYVNSLSMLNDDYKGIMEYIDELPVVPQEPCEDAISREEAQTAIEMSASRYTLAKEHDCMGQVEWSGQLIKVSDAVDIIRHLSSVTPQEPKTGQWVLLDECSNSGYYCSECHKKLVKEGWSNTVKKIKYCPNCGARMIEPQESEDKE